MSSLSLTNDEIFASLGHFLGVSRDPSVWDDVTVGDVNRIIRSGRRRYFSSNNWRYLNVPLVINTSPPFSEGTIEVVDGVVTLSGAVFPDDITRYVLVPSTGGVYSIAASNQVDEIELADTSVSLPAGTEYVVYRASYDLPANFGGWEGPVTRENNIRLQESRNMPEYTLRAVANLRRAVLGPPGLYTVDTVVDDETGVPTYRLRLYPLPDKVYVLNTKIKIQPGDSLDLDSDVPNTHPVFAEAMLAAILSAAEVTAFGTPGIHTQQYQMLIEEAKRIDGRMAGVRHGEPRGHRGRRDRLWDLRNATVVIEE